VSPISWKVSLDSLMRLSLSMHEGSESESRGIQSRGLLPEEVASTLSVRHEDVVLSDEQVPLY
jgi:hypothetical protein